MANGLFNLKQVNQAISQNGWPNQATPAVEYLVVAGGGGGGGAAAFSGTSHASGGGGAGGLLQGLLPISAGSSYTVTIGTGGAGGSGSVSGTNGVNSVFGAISATGGGGGGYGDQYGDIKGSVGGSAGGGSRYDTSINFGIKGQGNNGGGGYGAGQYGGGGGGGASSAGATSTSYGGMGGSGIASSIVGATTTYAGGGGGGGASNSTGGAGGVGGGGAGGGNSNGTAGTANTGGGGGGCLQTSSGTGGTGGSGIVIVSYPDVYAAATATTGSPTVSTSGSGSSYFNGSTYADYPASTSNRATGDFTLETWVNLSSFTGGGYSLWFSMDPNQCYWGAINSTTVVINLAGVELTWTTSTISTGVWYHMAAVRVGTTITLYINGVSQGTVTSSAVLGGAQPGAIRIGSAAGYAIFGYLSNFRYTKSAVYTSAFTPSTAPLPSLANTRLLLNTVSPSPFNDSSGIAQTPTVTGTSSWNQLSPFTGTGYKNRVYTWTSSGSITF